MHVPHLVQKCVARHELGQEHTVLGKPVPASSMAYDDDVQRLHEAFAKQGKHVCIMHMVTVCLTL